MKCPQMFMKWDSSEAKVSFEPMVCIQKECGQYDQTNQCCAPVALNQNLVAIGNTLGELVKVLGRIENQLYNK